MLSPSNHIVIPDVHGDYNQLLNVLSNFDIKADHNYQWSNPQNYRVVLLGDLNDPRLSKEEDNQARMSSYKCLKIAKSLNEQGYAIVLQSNHHRNLINVYYGRRKKLGYGLEFTKRELASLCTNEVYYIIKWLEKLPYYYTFVENGRIFVCVHAYYTPGMDALSPNKKEIEAALYGLKTEDRDRYPWWEDSNYYLKNRIVCAGHYHLWGMFPNESDPKAILLDANCGTDHGTLLAFTPSDMKIHRI